MAERGSKSEYGLYAKWFLAGFVCFTATYAMATEVKAAIHGEAKKNPSPPDTAELTGSEVTYDYIHPWEKTVDEIKNGQGQTLTYSIEGCPDNIDCELARKLIEQAVETWDENCGITLDEVESNGTIRIMWERGEHGDLKDFDGVGGRLGHTRINSTSDRSPNSPEGDTHLDAEDNWGDIEGLEGFPGVVNLRYVAMHEAGHAIGIGHAEDAKSVMNMVYGGGSPTLTQADIGVCNSMYPR